MDKRLEKQLAFSLEIDKEKNVFRQTHLSGHGRNENDAEHGVSASTIYGRQRKTKMGSVKLFEVTDQIIRDHIRKGTIPE